MKKEEIFEEAHENKSSQMARDYFKECKLKFSDLNINNCGKLREFINAEAYPLLLDESYSMIRELEANKKIKKDKYGIFLSASGSYFDDREAVSFYNPETNDDSITIGFCGWASGCNRIPFIKGFVKWCDWMFLKSKEEVIKK